jgi:hypothetical protein
VQRRAFNWKRLSVIGALAVAPNLQRVRVFRSWRPGNVDHLVVKGSSPPSAVEVFGMSKSSGDDFLVMMSSLRRRRIESQFSAQRA